MLSKMIPGQSEARKLKAEVMQDDPEVFWRWFVWMFCTRRSEVKALSWNHSTGFQKFANTFCLVRLLFPQHARVDQDALTLMSHQWFLQALWSYTFLKQERVEMMEVDRRKEGKSSSPAFSSHPCICLSEEKCTFTLNQRRSEDVDLFAIWFCLFSHCM